MIPSTNRMRRPAHFDVAVRRGRRSGRPTLVVHLAAGEEGTVSEPPLVGFIVSRSVGSAVVRNRVKRRLRHLASARLGSLSPGSLLVVRANPEASRCTYTQMSTDLDGALRTVRRRDRRP